MSTHTNLSIIILSHRADQRLEQSLQSSQFANEILIIDNNSGADWPALQQSYHFTVIPYSQPISDWSAVRNQALANAQHEWVFFLDSDEVIHPQSIPIIHELVQSPTYVGALINRTDVFHGKHLQYGEAGSMPLVRMGKKQHLHFERPVHEEAKVNGAMATDPITVYHHAHQSLNEFFQKITDYAHREAVHRPSQANYLLLPLMILLPIGKFIFNYFFKLGILDGWAGLSYAFMMSLHSFFVRVYQYEQQLSPQ
jgi:glycosyltransferase involved in cell wall biosynthesis